MNSISQIIASNLRALRAQQGLSLDALAKRSEVSKSRLAQIEGGQANPSLATVWQIAQGLNVEFSALVTPPVLDSVVVRKHDVAPLIEANGSVRNYSLFPYDAALGFETYSLEMDPNAHVNATAHPSGTKETVTVAHGSAAVTVDTNHYTLSQGDSIRFAADVSHEYHNTGDTLCTLSIIIAYPPRSG